MSEIKNSILNTIKKSVGIMPEYTHYDSDIILHINSTLSTLHQLGLGDGTLVIIDASQTWDLLLKERTDLEFVKSYIGLKVRLLFDPPSSSSVKDSFEKNVAEYEWRITNGIKLV